MVTPWHIVTPPTSLPTLVLTPFFCTSTHLPTGAVTRYALPGVWGWNFVLTRSLGGGGVSSLNVDRQGKTYGQLLLALEVCVPYDWVEDTNWVAAVGTSRL